VSSFAAAGPAEAVAHVGRGPLLVARSDCPRLGPEHAAAAVADLRAGCDLSVGATLDGGWYLLGLGEPRDDLLDLAAAADGSTGALLARAGGLRAEVGMLRHERALATPGDVAALLADPLVDGELRAALSA
jgi:glycosyltransferase A (GT-A) superfamily protein (DUF2064 family)